MYEDVPQPEEKKKTNVWLIVGISLVVLCCCCVVFTGLAWNFGDAVMMELGF